MRVYTMRKDFVNLTTACWQSSIFQKYVVSKIIDNISLSTLQFVNILFNLEKYDIIEYNEMNELNK